MKHFSEQPAYARQPNVFLRILRGLGEACLLIAIACWAAVCGIYAFGSAIVGTIFAGKDEQEQIGGGK